jgi:hypothetical protein
MSREGFTRQHRTIGRAAAWSYFVLSVIYVVATTLGLLSLQSPDEPIGDPYFTIMELLIVIIAPLLVIIMITVHAYAPAESKMVSLTALVFMCLLAGVTSCVHFVILTVRSQLETTMMTGRHLFLSFSWPSMAYALDILAWDVFFALSMLFAAFVFNQGRIEKAVRYLMMASGALSLLGLIGVPLANMTIRNIGIVGYAFVSPVAILLLSIVYGRTKVPSN